MFSFHVKFVQTDGQTDGWMDRWTMVKQYAPDLSIRGHKNMDNKVQPFPLYIKLGDTCTCVYSYLHSCLNVKYSVKCRHS